MRINGFSLPLNASQIIAWAVLCISILFYFAILLPPLEIYALLANLILYSVSLTNVIIWGYRCSKIDPTDVVVYAERQAKEKCLPFQYQLYNKICKICKTHVNEDSKHCGTCDRCVSGFDHHCKWVNNCIGDRNYLHFVLLIAALEIQVILQTCLGFFTIIGWYEEKDIRTQIEDLFSLNEITEIVYLIGLFTQQVLNFMILLANGHLIGLHVFLRCNNLTTYKYIVKKREQKNQSSKYVVPNDIANQIRVSYEPYIITRQEEISRLNHIDQSRNEDESYLSIPDKLNESLHILPDLDSTSGGTNNQKIVEQNPYSSEND